MLKIEGGHSLAFRGDGSLSQCGWAGGRGRGEGEDAGGDLGPRSDESLGGADT